MTRTACWLTVKAGCQKANEPSLQKAQGCPISTAGAAAIVAWGRPAAEVRLAWIHDSLHTELLGVSPALLKEADGRDDLEVARGPEPMPFGQDRELEPLHFD